MKNKNNPPLLAKTLLNWFSIHRLKDSFIGDMNENYFTIINNKGKFKADLWYWMQLLNSLPEIINYFIKSGFGRFKNYFKSTIRYLLKHKIYSVINLTGLIAGITSSILIMLYVQYELSYDDYHKKSDRIYRISREWVNSNGETTFHLNTVIPPIGPGLVKEYPEISSMVRFYKLEPIVSNNENSYLEERFYAVDKNVFDMFSWKLLTGVKSNVLDEPGMVVISKSTSMKYFGNKDPIGKVLDIKVSDRTFNLSVSGIMEDTPAKSHVHFDFLMSMATLRQLIPNMEKIKSSNDWGTYVLLPKDYPINQLEKKMQDFMVKLNSSTKLHFWKLTDIHLQSHLDSEYEQNGNFLYVYIFSIVSVLIILIACFNFINLSTARAATRAKEVGVRKIVGAVRKQLIFQFLIESFTFAICALTISIILISIFLPSFNSIINLSIEFSTIYSNVFLLGFIGLLILIGFISGIYPALYMSSLLPITIIMDTANRFTGASLFRKGLTTSQFIVSMLLIISVLLINEQLNYMMNKDLGFNKNNLINVDLTSEMIPSFRNIKTRLLENPDIIYVSGSSRIPSGQLLDTSGGRVANGDTLGPITFRLPKLRVEKDYFRTYGMQILAGRNFNDSPSDTLNSFIINETATKKFGWDHPSAAVDKPIYYDSIDGKIIGVVKDFNFESLRQEIQPMIFYYEADLLNSVSIKIKPGSIESVNATINKIWGDYNPRAVIKHNFIDDLLGSQYQSEQLLSQMLTVFSLFAVFISFLGLVGMAFFFVERRLKEIGIRKVLGAGITTIITLILKDFFSVILTAFILVIPIAIYLSEKWLINFAYRVEGISIGLIATTLGITIFTVLIATGYQITKAYLTNVVNIIKSD